MLDAIEPILHVVEDEIGKNSPPTSGSPHDAAPAIEQ